MFDLTKLDNSKIIFNHIPKAGGSSLYFFFQDLFGADKVFRYKTRNVETEIVSMEDLTQEERDQHYIFQGHFHYGYHTLFAQPILYFGIIRDPIERIVSNYFYLQAKGQPKAKEYAHSVSLEEYFQKRLEESGDNIGSIQTKFLTGKDTFEEAKTIIENEYFLCCTTKQLDGCQRLLSQVYKKKLDAKKRNVTASDEKSGDTLEALKKNHRDLFETDYKTMQFVRHFFNSRRDDIRSQLGVELKPSAKKQAAAQKAKPTPGGKAGPAAKSGPLAKKNPTAKKVPAGAAAASKPQAKAATAKGSQPKQKGSAANAGQANKASQTAKKGPAPKVGTAKAGAAKQGQGQAKAGPKKAGPAKAGQSKPGGAKAAQAKAGTTKPGQPKSGAAKPGQVKQGPAKVAQGKASAAKAGQAKAGPAKAGQAKQGPAKVAQGRAGAAKAGAAKAGPAKAGPAKAGPAKAGAAKAGAAKPGQPKAGQAKQGPVKAAQGKAGAAKAGPAKAGPAKTGQASAGAAKPGRPNLKVVG